MFLRSIGLAVVVLGVASCDHGQGRQVPDDLSAAAQSDVTLIERCRTQGCVVGRENVLVLKESDHPGLLSDYPAIQEFSDGRFVMANRMRNGLLFMNASGALESQFGRPGSGPEEFERIVSVLVGPADSLLVYDLMLQRVSVFAPDGTYVRSEYTIYGPTLALDNGDFILAQHIGTPEAAGYPLHVMALNGTIRRSFGSAAPHYRYDIPLETRRVVALSDPGLIWSAAPGRYELEQWDYRTGELVKRVKSHRAWFPPVVQLEADGERPVTIIEDLIQDDHGMVWVLMRVADDKWEPPPPIQGERPWTPEYYDNKHDWVLEAIDPTSGDVLASTRLGQMSYVAPGSEFIVSSTDTTYLAARFQAWRPFLHNEEGR